MNNHHFSLLEMLSLSPSDLSGDAQAIRGCFLGLLQHLPNHIYWADKNGVLLGCNEKVLGLIGVNKYDDILGKTYEEISTIAGWDVKQTLLFKKADQEVMLTGKAKLNVEEPVFYSVDGDAVYYLSNREPLYDEQKNIIGIVVVLVDITVLKQSPQKIAVNSTKISSVSDVSAPMMLPHILVVEDHLVAAIAAKNVLEKLGFTVDLAETGEQALFLAKEKNYALIFMDVGLPDINGYVVTQKIRDDKLLAASTIPIVGLTAQADEITKTKCLSAGMDAVLTKPLTREKVESTFAAFIPYYNFARSSSLEEIFEKVIDRQVIERSLGNEVTMMEEILDLLEISLTEETEQLNNAYNQKNWVAALAITCKIKGSCDYAGALRLKAACTALEKALREGHHELLEECCQNLLIEMLAVRKAIRSRNY